MGLPRYLGSSRSLDNPSWQIAELGFKGVGMKCASNPTNWGCSKRYKKDKADVSKPCNAMPSVCKIVLSCPAAMVDGNLWGLFWALLASTKRQEDRYCKVADILLRSMFAFPNLICAELDLDYTLD